MGFVARLAQTNQQINSIIFGKEYNKELSYFSLMLHFDNAKAKTGNVFANMNKEEFASIYIAYPSIELLQKYHEIVLPMFDTIKTNTSEILNLIKQRDELLPLLMNGQVSVNYHLSLLEVVGKIPILVFFVPRRGILSTTAGNKNTRPWYKTISP